MDSTTPTTTPERPKPKKKNQNSKGKEKKNNNKKEHDAKVSATKKRLQEMFKSTPDQQIESNGQDPESIFGLKKELEMLKTELARRTGEL